MIKKAGTEFAILLVDDEEEILFSSSIMLRTEGFSNVLTEKDSRKVLQTLETQDVSLILLDLNMPHLSGYQLLKDLSVNYPHIPVIVMTAANELELAVDCMKVGAFDYFVKPADTSRLLLSMGRALEMHGLRNQVSLLTQGLLSDPLEQHEAFNPIVTRSPKMRSIFQYLRAIAGTEQPVLIMGETGVGKELIARSLHQASARTGAFVAVNVAGLDDHMFSDALFGHSKGAFTGADQTREGLIAKACGGTLFLDEIGDLSLFSQIKLLRLLQEGEYYPLGSDAAKTNASRVVVATNSDLAQKIDDKGFRNDLFYRLSTHQVRIPPLRERLEDLPLLVELFLDEACESLRKPRPAHPAELLQYLASYDFPGNVRELKALIFDAVARHHKGVLSLASFREVIGTRGTLPGGDPLQYLQQVGCGLGELRAMPTLKEAEEALVGQALRLAGGNQGIAASYLGITRQALNKRLTRKSRGADRRST